MSKHFMGTLGSVLKKKGTSFPPSPATWNAGVMTGVPAATLDNENKGEPEGAQIAADD